MFKQITFLGLLLLLAFPISSNAQTLEELGVLTQDLEDRLDEIETKTILDKIRVGAELRTKVQHVSIDKSVGAGGEDRDSDDLWTNRFRLNFDADVNKDIVFRSRLSFFNLHNESTLKDNYTLVSDQKRTTSDDGEIKLERAYMDWFIPDSDLSLSVGRLPLGDGPPLEFRDDTSRQGTYPLTIFDGAFDGTILSYNLEKTVGIDDAVVRLVYSKFFTDFAELEGMDEFENSTAYALGWESAIPGVKNSFMWISALLVEDFGTFGVDVPGAIVPKSLTDTLILTAHFQAENIAKSGLDAFYSFNWQNWDNSGNHIVFPAGTLAPIDVAFSATGSSLAGNLDDDQDAYLHYAGLRYELPLRSLKKPKVGFEFTHQTKYANMAFGGEGLFNKLETLGQTYEIYYIQPLYRELKARLGYIIHEEEYDDTAFGEPPESEQSMHEIYLLLDLRF